MANLTTAALAGLIAAALMLAACASGAQSARAELRGEFHEAAIGADDLRGRIGE